MFANSLKRSYLPAVRKELFKPVSRTPTLISPLRINQSRNVYNQYQHFQNMHRGQTSRFKKFLYVGMALVAINTFVYYYYWPKHTFPKSVAKILRKGLWAESNKGDADWQLALKYYIGALQECDRLQMDPLCDEYTGIQIKIAEMYERLGMNKEAGYVFHEMSTLYLSVLRAPPKSKMGMRIQNRSHRGHLIQRALRIALKTASLNQDEPHLIKAILLTHLMVAQDEVKKKMGGPELEAIAKKEGFEAFHKDQPILESNPDAFEPFANEYFGAYDLLSVVCLQLQDIDTALWARVKMTNEMMSARASPDKLLLSQCNVASLLYMWMEKKEAELMQLNKSLSEKINVPYEKIKALESGDSELTKKERDDIEQKIKSTWTSTEYSIYKEHHKVLNDIVKKVLSTFESVIQGWKALPAELKDSSLDQTAAIATYGIGVVNLHIHKYDDAERYLREARVRSKKCGYEVLINEIEREMTKLKKERVGGVEGLDVEDVSSKSLENPTEGA
ncbi:hypothetical protein CJJ07_003074 [Candidozyma auris]|nr:hypothetical protein CJJ07_003074 [[Candida] auris]